MRAILHRCIFTPEMDGIELIQAIRLVPPTLPIIAVSSCEPAELVLNAARLLGADRTLRRPISASVIGTTIAGLLIDDQISDTIEEATPPPSTCPVAD